jgi:triosephosphate isomerase
MQKFIVGNWKMYGDPAAAHPLVEAVAAHAAKLPAGVQVVVCPPSLLAVQVTSWLIGANVKTGGQDCHAQPEGAFTGDVSARMLADSGCAYVIAGHSERRLHHCETSEMVGHKAAAAIAAGLIPIICIGETAEERDTGIAESVVAAQLRQSIPKQAAAGNFVLAYEPVWAIGSGRTPTQGDIARMHAYIVSVATERTGLAAEHIAVLYGGSVKAENARGIMAIAGVSGVLVGGASLKANEFCGIISAALPQG